MLKELTLSPTSIVANNYICIKSKDLANLVLSCLTEPNNEIGFASDNNPSMGICGWYFIRRLCLEDINSNILFIDYAGGGSARCTSLECKTGFTNDDETNVAEFVKTYIDDYEDDCPVWVSLMELKEAYPDIEFIIDDKELTR